MNSTRSLWPGRMEDVTVEVRGENGAYYQAFVRDILDDGHVVVSFENK